MRSQSHNKDLAILDITLVQVSGYLSKRKFAHLNDLSICSFDCMVLRSFHTQSQYDFRSNVIRPSQDATNEHTNRCSFKEIKIVMCLMMILRELNFRI